MITYANYALPDGVETLTLGGTDGLIGLGNSQSNTLIGNAASNVLGGGGGSDTLFGGEGNDILRGDAGTDHLYGGAGTDVFVLTAVQDSGPGEQRDVVYDFDAGEDALHFLDLAPGVPITYLGYDSFQVGVSAVQTRLDVRGADGILQIDMPDSDGRTDGVVDAEIMLIGVQSLQMWNIMDAVDPSSVDAPPSTDVPPFVIDPPVFVAPTTGRTVFIDPSASGSGDGSVESPFNSWSVGELEPDTSYLIKANTVMNGFAVTGLGTEEAPIVVGSYGLGAAPVIQGTIDVSGAAHVTIAGLTIENSASAGIAVMNGSRDVTLQNNTIENTRIGIWFDSETGGGNLIQGNRVADSWLYGIAFNKLDHSGDPTRVVGNDIRDNGSHGIEINANGIVIDGNDVSNNGGVITGSSGIHVYGGYGEVTSMANADGFGYGNVIINNRVTDTREAADGFDGNGIQADQYTGYNRIENNIVTGSDGAGIILYDSWSNVVAGNTVSGNQVDRSGRHPYNGEILLAADSDVMSELTRGNVIQYNVVTTDDDVTSAFYIDLPTADNGNIFGDNTVIRAGGGPAFTSGGVYGTVSSDLALWNNVLAPGGGDDFWN